MSNTLWGFAELVVVPLPEWMAAWATRVAAVIDTLPSQVVVNSLWALTVFQMQKSDIFVSLLLQALRLLTQKSDERHLRSFYDVFQIAAAERVDGLPTADASLLEAAEKAWNTLLAEFAQQRASVDHTTVMSTLRGWA